MASNPRSVLAAEPKTPARHTIGRRPVLPNGRAVVGGLLVAAAAVGTFAAWSGAGDGPTTTYVVAAADLPVGHALAAGDLTLAALDVPPSLAARAFDSVDPVVGQLTVAPLAAGELVQRSAVVVPEGASAGRQVSFAIDVADALAGTIEEGETVDLLVTYSGDDGPVTEVVAAAARVARLPDAGVGGAGRLVVLLALAPGTDVLAVTSAIRSGDLTLVRSGTEGPLPAGESFQPSAGAGRPTTTTTTTTGTGG